MHNIRHGIPCSSARRLLLSCAKGDATPVEGPLFQGVSHISLYLNKPMTIGCCFEM